MKIQFKIFHKYLNTKEKHFIRFIVFHTEFLTKSSRWEMHDKCFIVCQVSFVVTSLKRIKTYFSCERNTYNGGNVEIKHKTTKSIFDNFSLKYLNEKELKNNKNVRYFEFVSLTNINII